MNECEDCRNRSDICNATFDDISCTITRRTMLGWTGLRRMPGGTNVLATCATMTENDDRAQRGGANQVGYLKRYPHRARNIAACGRSILKACLCPNVTLGPEIDKTPTLIPTA